MKKSFLRTNWLAFYLLIGGFMAALYRLTQAALPETDRIGMGIGLFLLFYWLCLRWLSANAAAMQAEDFEKSMGPHPRGGKRDAANGQRSTKSKKG